VSGDDFASRVESFRSSYQLFAHAPRLLVPLHNNAWFSMYCHPLLRLFCPWLLLLTCAGALSGALLAPPDSLLELRLLESLALGQLAVCLLALLGENAGKPGLVARHLLLLAAAGLWGFFCFLRQPRGAQQVA
jgi:hypothetical protein